MGKTFNVDRSTIYRLSK
ncbi:hypothetical protein ACLFKQ_30315 [Myxosarcina sp. GI1(2024)]